MTSQYFMPIYSTIVGIVIGALVTWLKSLIGNRKQKQDVIEALVDGMAILLRKEIKEYYVAYEHKDSIPMTEWEDIELTHKVYKQLNGNHSGDRMYEEMKAKHLEGAR